MSVPISSEEDPCIIEFFIIIMNEHCSFDFDKFSKPSVRYTSRINKFFVFNFYDIRPHLVIKKYM